MNLSGYDTASEHKAVMAGMSSLTGGLYSGQWFRCPDGSLMEPLDYLHLLFPNQGRNIKGGSLCLKPQLFSVPLVNQLLPEEHPDDFFLPNHLVDGVVSLAVCTLVATILMTVIKWVWSFDSHFAAITPAHKQWYVVANICKATILAMVALSPRFWTTVYQSMALDRFPVVEVYRTATICVATDVATLIMVPKLPTYVIIHHVTYPLLCIMDSAINLQLKGWSGLLGVAKMSIVFGMYFAPAFVHTLYLALRVVYPKAKWEGSLIKVSLCGLMLRCAVNWSSQVLWIARLVWNWEVSVPTVLFLIPLSVMVYADVALIQGLLMRISYLSKKKGGY